MSRGSPLHSESFHNSNYFESLSYIYWIRDFDKIIHIGRKFTDKIIMKFKSITGIMQRSITSC